MTEMVQVLPVGVPNSSKRITSDKCEFFPNLTKSSDMLQWQKP